MCRDARCKKIITNYDRKGLSAPQVRRALCPSEDGPGSLAAALTPSRPAPSGPGPLPRLPLLRYGIILESVAFAVLSRECLVPLWGTNMPFVPRHADECRLDRVEGGPSAVRGRR